ncbi:hypothetical protein BDD12DRAFT_517544 [Trichophaea hybrida]|nr:hypothetical protein BDD12DRAFT_517544 [Trichophaea hybrida]
MVIMGAGESTNKLASYMSLFIVMSTCLVEPKKLSLTNVMQSPRDVHNPVLVHHKTGRKAFPTSVRTLVFSTICAKFAINNLPHTISAGSCLTPSLTLSYELACKARVRVRDIIGIPPTIHVSLSSVSGETGDHKNSDQGPSRKKLLIRSRMLGNWELGIA